MKDFQEFRLENMGGIDSFNFIPHNYINVMPKAFDNIITDTVVPISGKLFNKGASIFKSLKFEETSTETNGGLLYKYKISGLYPGQSAYMHSLFDSMARMRHVVDIIDNMANRRLIGSKDNPAKFSFGYQTKDVPSARPDYEFVFTWESSEIAPYYNI